MDSLGLQLIDAGLATHAGALVSLALPAVQLLGSDVQATEAVVGATRLGGVPDVPSDF